MISGVRPAACGPVPARQWAPLAVLFASLGVAHFVRGDVVDALVPRVLPGPARSWTQASGVVEFGLAAGLAIPATRLVTGRAAAAFLLAVWPGNAQMALDAWRRHRGDRGRADIARCVIAFGRLPLQVPLVRAAWRAGTPR
ncbi:MAG: DoxX family protein [Janthinobacterium lividum]